MTLVLDAGAVSALARDRLVLRRLREQGAWPPLVPAVVLVESLTGDHRRDHATNRFLRMCQVVDVDEPLARHAARLREKTGRAGTIAATDALVVALAATLARGEILTSDPDDLGALAAQCQNPIAIVAV